MAFKGLLKRMKPKNGKFQSLLIRNFNKQTLKSCLVGSTASKHKIMSDSCFMSELLVKLAYLKFIFLSNLWLFSKQTLVGLSLIRFMFSVRVSTEFSFLKFYFSLLSHGSF